MALSTELIALLRQTSVQRLDLHLQRMTVLRSVHAMAAGAGGFSLAKTPGQRECLRPVEAARASVGPEVALRIVVWNRLTDQERQRVVLVALAGLEAEEHVVLVPVAVAAGIEHLPRRRAQRGENLQVRRCWILWLRRRVLLPLRRHRRVRGARSVTRFAADAHLGPCGRVAVRRRIKVLDQVGGVAVDARDVPDLTQVVIGIVRDRRNLLPVDPSLRFVVPEDGQNVDAAVGQLREIALKAPRAERVMDLERLGRPFGRFRDGDEVAAVASVEGIAASVLAQSNGRRTTSLCRGTEVALDLRLRDRLGHLDVKRPPPRVVGRLMTALARLGSQIGRFRCGRRRRRERDRDEQRHRGETDQDAAHGVTIMPAVTLWPLRSFLLLSLACLTAQSLAPAAQVIGSARTALATVEDIRTGRRVVDVGADDFVVQEGAEEREVLSVRPADYPVE